MAKRNKNEDEQVKDNAPVLTNDEPTPETQAEKPAPISADKMAAEIAVSGNSYQQYARQMFKDRLGESR